MKSHIADRGISWHFSVQRAAWMGGAWERLVHSVKRCLRKVIGRTSLIYEELHTLLVEIEGIVNARPITYIYDDTEGISYPLTPSEIIYGYTVNRTPNDKHFEIISTNESLSKRAKYHRQLLQQFSKRWKNEYLLSIREIPNQKGPITKPDAAVGDIVVLKNEQTKRQFWKLARICELIVGKDDNVRAAKIKVAGERSTILTRALKHLSPLEISCREPDRQKEVVKENSVRDTDIQKQEPVVNDRSPVRSSRQTAAVIGEIRRKHNR